MLVVLILTSVLTNVNTVNAQQENKFGILTFNKAVNISGKQRMLSQKMAKSYLYLVSNPSDTKAKRDLITSKIIFEKQNKIILQNSKYKVTKDKLVQVNNLWEKYKKNLESTPNYENAKIIIDLNTDLLKATNDVVSAIIIESKRANEGKDNVFDEGGDETSTELKQIINTAGRQRMLSQRLALYYFTNQAALKSQDYEQMLKNVYYELDGAITMLLISEFNNSQIDEKLGIAMSKWEEVKNNKEKLFNQGFQPKEMYRISNELTAAFNAVTVLYEKVKP